MVVHPVITRVIIPAVVGFSDPLHVMVIYDPLPITVISDPLIVTDLVSEVSRMDPDTFTPARGSYFLRPIPILSGNPILFLNLFISLFHSHLASLGILSTSIIFTLSN